MPLVCPACQTNHTDDEDREYCIQCGSDIYVHRLLRDIREERQMKNETTSLTQEMQKVDASDILFIVQFIACLTFLICAIGGIYVGMRFLAFMDHEEAYHRAIVNTEPPTSFAQWHAMQEMNAIVKKELDLIVDQRRENQLLREKVLSLTSQAPLAPAAQKSIPSPPLHAVGVKQ